jgi:hypothetical protein
VFLTAGTMALFTGAQGVPGNGFTTGTIDLRPRPQWWSSTASCPPRRSSSAR